MILNKLNLKDTFLGLRYHGINDMATNWHITEIFENVDKLLKYYNESFNFELLTIDDYIDYLFLNTFIEYEDVISYLKRDKDKENLKKFIINLKKVKEKVEAKHLIKFLANSFKIIYEYDKNKYIKYDIKIKTINLIAKYNNVLTLKSIEYLIEKDLILVFDNLDILSKSIKRISKDLYKSIFLEEKNLNEICKFRLDELLKIIPNLEFKDNLLEKLMNRADIDIKEFKEKRDTQKAMNLLIKLPKVYECFYRSKSKETEKIKKKIDKVKEELDKYLIEVDFYQGEKIEISSENYYNFLKGLDFEKNYGFLFYSLTYEINDNIYDNINILEKFSNEYKNGLIDFVSTPEKRNDFFTEGRLSSVNYLLIEMSLRNLVWLEEDKKPFLYKMIYLNICEINEKLNIFYEPIDLKKQLKALEVFIDDSLSSEKGEYYSYTAIFYISSLIEKILREVYCSIHEEGFFQSDKITLGGLLIADELKKLVGDDTLKWLYYYLLKEERESGRGDRFRLSK